VAELRPPVKPRERRFAKRLGRIAWLNLVCCLAKRIRSTSDKESRLVGCGREQSGKEGPVAIVYQRVAVVLKLDLLDGRITVLSPLTDVTEDSDRAAGRQAPDSES